MDGYVEESLSEDSSEKDGKYNLVDDGNSHSIDGSSTSRSKFVLQSEAKKSRIESQSTKN